MNGIRSFYSIVLREMYIFVGCRGRERTYNHLSVHRRWPFILCYIFRENLVSVWQLINFQQTIVCILCMQNSLPARVSLPPLSFTEYCICISPMADEKIYHRTFGIVAVKKCQFIFFYPYYISRAANSNSKTSYEMSYFFFLSTCTVYNK